MVGFEDPETLFTHSNNRRTVTEIYLAIEQGESENAFWPPGPENPAGGLTKSRNDLVPPRTLLGAGPFFPGTLRPLEGWQLVSFPG